jgi:prepilin-type processing-associated H-X9-DG protein
MMDVISFRLLACSSSAAPASSGNSAFVVAASVVGGSWFALLLAIFFVHSWRKTLSHLAMAYGAVTVLVAMLLPDVNAARDAARRSSCDCNLKGIGLALQTYADIYKSFPPAYVTDKKGNRMHSWRVLILPFMEQRPLYEMYDFNEPWNGPHNRKLAQYMPPIYRCPSDDLSRAGETRYATIEGPGTLMSNNKGSKFGQVKDGTSNTIAVIEAAGAGIDWMEPRDLPFASLRGGATSSAQPGPNSRHRDMCDVVFADGHTGIITPATPVKTVQALATRAGGETINGDW